MYEYSVLPTCTSHSPQLFPTIPVVSLFLSSFISFAFNIIYGHFSSPFPFHYALKHSCYSISLIMCPIESVFLFVTISVFLYSVQNLSITLSVNPFIFIFSLRICSQKLQFYPFLYFLNTTFNVITSSPVKQVLHII